MQGKARWPKQPTPVVAVVVERFAELLRESSGKHDDRRSR